MYRQVPLKTSKRMKNDLTGPCRLLEKDQFWFPGIREIGKIKALKYLKKPLNALKNTLFFSWEMTLKNRACPQSDCGAGQTFFGVPRGPH